MATGYKDYYKTLGVARTANDKEVKSAFRKLARKHHPDLNPGDPGAEARFKEVNEAHEVLADPEKRKLYDQYGPGWERGGMGGVPFPGPGGRPVEYRTTSPADLEELFGSASPFSEFFHSMFGSAGRPAAPARRGADVEGEVTITLEEAAAGTARTVETESPRGGRRRVEVKIPGGIADGARVRAAGQGAGGDAGGTSGDLYIRVRISPHPLFRRDGDDLQVSVEVPLDVALLGGQVEVPTIKGSRVSLTVPAETQNGRVLRLRGLGMPRLKGKGSGDLHAEVDVRLPLPLTPELKAWAEGLRASADPPRQHA